MKAEIKYIHSPDIEDLATYRPIDNESFSFLLQVVAGPEGSDGEESFDITVCTPKWLLENRNNDDIIIARHNIIMFKYDWLKLVERIENFVRGCIGADWNECALKLSRLGYWEFEDYQEDSAK